MAQWPKVFRRGLRFGIVRLEASRSAVQPKQDHGKARVPSLSDGLVLQDVDGGDLALDRRLAGNLDENVDRSSNRLNYLQRSTFDGSGEFFPLETAAEVGIMH